MSRFSDQVPILNHRLEFLPVFHTCDAYTARDYLEGGRIETHDVCEVFAEKITYLFYGRPAYKYAITETSTTNSSIYPICFILNAEKIGKPVRVYPFDTGALHHGRYQSHIHRKSKVADFALAPDLNRISDVIRHFHGNNEGYLDYKLQNLEIDRFDFESIAYREMHNSFQSGQADERRVTIEVHAEEQLSLDKGVVEAIIVPTDYLGTKLLRKFIKETGAKVRSYDIETWDPNLSFPIVAKLARQYIRKRVAGGRRT